MFRDFAANDGRAACISRSSELVRKEGADADGATRNDGNARRNVVERERGDRGFVADARIDVERLSKVDGRDARFDKRNREWLGQSAGRKAFVARGVRDGADLLLDRGLLNVELLQEVRGKTPTESGFRNQLHVLRRGFLMHGGFRSANFGEISLQGV